MSVDRAIGWLIREWAKIEDAKVRESMKARPDASVMLDLLRDQQLIFTAVQALSRRRKHHEN